VTYFLDLASCYTTPGKEDILVIQSVHQAIQIIQEALVDPVETWPGYSPQAIPLLVFDDDEVAYLNHPAPPQARPSGLMAATAAEIGGELTATLPLWMFKEDAEHLVPLVYHECFHVYQDGGAFTGIVPAPDFSFHRALSFYPELDPHYRALCRAEADTHNNASLSLAERAAYLAALAAKRYEILSQHSETLFLERMTERQEGSAFYVQQIAELRLTGTPPPSLEARFGYSRQYYFGAANCHLLSQFGGDWHRPIETGLAPSEVLQQKFGQEAPELDAIHLEPKVEEETEQVRQVLDGVEQSPGERGIRLQVPPNAMRGFNPMSVLALRDGRLIHTDIYILQLPSGSLSLKQGKLVEDYVRNEIWLPPVVVSFDGGRLTATSDVLEMDLSGIVQVGDGIYRCAKMDVPESQQA
jgi:hypothetical protein